jgi:hypothetical protein
MNEMKRIGKVTPAGSPAMSAAEVEKSRKSYVKSERDDQYDVAAQDEWAIK